MLLLLLRLRRLVANLRRHFGAAYIERSAGCLARRLEVWRRGRGLIWVV